QEERARALSGRADSLEAAARNELAARERAAARRRRRAQDPATAAAVAAGAAYLAGRVEHPPAGAAAGRDRVPTEPAAPERALAGARARAHQLVGDLRELTDSVHADEIARAEQRLRIETLQARAMDELGVDPAVLVDEFGPHLPVPVLADTAA